MVGITVNINGVKEGVNPKLEKTNKTLEKVIDNITSLDIPSDFKYKTTLKKYPSKIKDIKKDVKTIKKNVTKIITDFEKAEKKSATLLNQSLAQMDLTISQTKKNEEKTKPQDLKINENESADLGEFLKNLGTSIYQTGGKVVNAFATGNKKAFNLVADVGAVYAKLRAPEVNIITSLLKGFGKLGEHLYDANKIKETMTNTSFTGLIDFVRYLFATDKGDFKSWTKNMWKNTMAEVATEHVENGFSGFYKYTKLGNFLDENAGEIFKSDGTACRVTTELGEVIGIIAISLFTAGAGGAAVGASAGASSAGAGIAGGASITTAGIATVSGLGKYTEEYWKKARDSSWEGMKELYEKGEITDVQFNSYQMIRAITPEDWKQIEEAYKNGELEKEQFNLMKQIREMPEDWTTTKNMFKGLTYGSAKGIWEGVQWYVGGKLATWTLKGASATTTSSVRVGADVVFDGLDTPVRAAIDASTTDKSFEDAWNEQGGWKAVLIDSGLSLVGKMDVGSSRNLGFYTSNNPNLKNVVKSQWDVFNVKTVDEAIEISIKKQGKKVTNELMQKYRTALKNGDYSKITKEQGAREFVKKYFSTEVNSIDDAIELTLRAHGSKTQNINARRLQIQMALAEGDLSCITNYNGARTVVENIYNLKAKKYLDLSTNKKIFKHYGGLSNSTNKKIRNILDLIHYDLNNGKIDGDINFINFLKKQNIDKNMEKELVSYAKYDTWLRNLTLREAKATYSYTYGSRSYTNIFRYWKTRLQTI